VSAGVLLYPSLSFQKIQHARNRSCHPPSTASHSLWQGRARQGASWVPL